MKSLKILFLFACVVSISFFSCKDDETDIPAETGDIGAFLKNKQPQSQFFTVNAAQYQTITGTEGTQIFFPQGSFRTASGTIVNSGTVNVELKEIYNVKDMIYSNISTVSNGGILISGGQIYIAARQNGQALRMNKNNSAYMSMPTTNTSQPMQMFYGNVQVVNGESTVAWTVADSTVTTPIADSSSSLTDFSYTFNLDSLSWINCDYFYGSGSTLTEVFATVPDTFDYENTAVYIVFSSINSVARFSSYNDATHTFSISGGYEVPIGINATIAAIAEKNGQYYYYSHAVTVANHHVEPVVFSPSTEAAIEAALNAL